MAAFQQSSGTFLCLAILGLDLRSQSEFGLVKIDTGRVQIQYAREISIAGILEFDVLASIGGHDGAFAVRIGDVLGERLGVGVLDGT